MMRARLGVLAAVVTALMGCDALEDLDTGVGLDGPDTGRELWRVPPPDVGEGCELWEGVREGDAADVLLELVLCSSPGAEEVWGELQISDATSWSLRRVQGERVTGGLWLTDVDALREAPTDGGRYCWVDDYHLDLPDPDWMEGSTFSLSCDEALRVGFERVAPP